jgi:germination protein M
MTCAVLAFLMLLSGCGSEAASAGEEVAFYYVNDADTGASIQSEEDWVEVMDIPHLMQRLLDGPDNLLLQNTFPSGTQLQSWSNDNGTVKLDLSEAFGRLSGIALTQAEYCIVLTLDQLPEVERVTITVDGQSLPGASSQARSAQEVILKGETEDPVYFDANLYFPKADGSGLGAEYRQFTVTSLDVDEQANAILRALVSGPNDETLSGFLDGASVLEVSEITDGVCSVELNVIALKCLRSSTQESQLQRYAIIDSLTQLEGINSVTFQLNGQPINGWTESYTPNFDF